MTLWLILLKLFKVKSNNLKSIDVGRKWAFFLPTSFRENIYRNSQIDVVIWSICHFFVDLEKLYDHSKNPADVLPIFFFLPMSIQENLNIFSRIDVGRLCMFFLPASCRAPADVLQMKSWHKLSHRCRHVPIGRNFMIRQKNYPKMNFKSFYTHRVFDTIFFCFGQMKAYR